ncbi:RNA polymerase sigma factor [Cytobacillus sp. Hm23]
MKKAQKRDDQAFLTLFEHYQEDKYRIAYVYVKNQSDALDVVQEVAYRSFKKIHTLKNPKYFKTWLLKITINCAIDLTRKNNKVIQLETEHEKFMGSEDGDVSLSVTLEELLNQLNEDEKSIIILKFYQGYSLKEIADLLKMPLGTAKSVFYRALHKLRKKFKEAQICE